VDALQERMQESLESMKRECDRLSREAPGTKKERRMRARAASIEVQMEKLRATLAQFDRADPPDSAR
jgi:hypothetical protein